MQIKLIVSQFLIFDFNFCKLKSGARKSVLTTNFKNSNYRQPLENSTHKYNKQPKDKNRSEDKISNERRYIRFDNNR